MKRTLRLLLSTATACAVLPSPANAGEAKVTRDAEGYPTRLEYSAAPGETNVVTLEPTGTCVPIDCWPFVDVLVSDLAGVAAVPPSSDDRAKSGCLAAGPTAALCRVYLSSISDGGGLPTQVVIARVALGEGNDRLRSSFGVFPAVEAGAGDDALTAVYRATLHGGPGNDRVELRTDAKIEPGPFGTAARFFGTDGVLTGGDGDDELIAHPADATSCPPFTFYCESGGTTLLDGGPGADRMTGGGTTLLDGGPDADRMTGGWVDYRSRTQPLHVTADGIANDGEIGEGDNVSPDVHGIFGGSAGDKLELSALAAVRGNDDTYEIVNGYLFGFGGADILVGGPGHDYIAPGDGADTVDAKAGGDWVSGRDGVVDQISCGDGDDSVHVDLNDLVDACETVDRAPLPEAIAPSSRITAAPASATTTPVSLAYSASDPEPSSGLQSIRLFVKAPRDTAYERATYASISGKTAEGSLQWSPQRDGTHGLYTVAYDRAGNSESPPADPDATVRVELFAPSVENVSPTGSGVAVLANVSVTFSEEMDKTSAEQAFRLAKSDGTAVTGKFSWSATTMTFTPSRRLSSSTTYHARVASSARDLADKPLKAEHSWSFTT